MSAEIDNNSHHSKLIPTGLFLKICIDKQICCQEKPKLDDYTNLLTCAAFVEA